MSVIAAAVVAASLLAAPAPVQKAFLQGETLDYRLTWLRMTGGTARMTIGADGNDRIRIRSVAKSSPAFSRIFKVRDELESIVGRGDFSTLIYTKRLDERGRKSEEVTVIDGGVATRTKESTSRTDVPRPVYDPVSVIYHLRTLDLTVGKAHDLTLIADGKVYEVRARVTRRESVRTPAGTFSTVLVEPEMVSGGQPREERLFIWYSDDERRIPVRIRTELKVGAITATLQGVQSGVAAADPPTPGQR